MQSLKVWNGRSAETNVHRRIPHTAKLQRANVGGDIPIKVDELHASSHMDLTRVGKPRGYVPFFNQIKRVGNGERCDPDSPWQIGICRKEIQYASR